VKAKPVVPREQANRVFDEIIDHYLNEQAELAAIASSTLSSRRTSTMVGIPASARRATVTS